MYSCDAVTRVARVHPPEKTVDGALAFLLRVIAALPPEEAAGLIEEDGENTADYQGHTVRVSRVCYPDGSIYKILTDVPTTNGPQWADNGMIDPEKYLAVVSGPNTDLPSHPSEPGVLTPPIDTIDTAALLNKLDDQMKQADANRVLILGAINDLKTDLQRIEKNATSIGSQLLAAAPLLGGLFGRKEAAPKKKRR